MRVVFETMTKSSAVSVWILPGLAGRERVAIFPSGEPVENEKEAAEARETSRSKAIVITTVLWAESAANPNGHNRRRTGVSFIDFVLLRSFIITCSIVCLFPALLTGARSVTADTFMTRVIGYAIAPNESDSHLQWCEKQGGKQFQ